MKDLKDVHVYKVEKYDTKPRAHREIKDQLPGIVVVPGFLADKLTPEELKLLLSWNGLSDDEPVYFEELVRPWEVPGKPLGRPPMVYSRERLARPEPK